MANKNEQLIQSVSKKPKPGDELRIMPFAVAGLFCFTVAIILGTGSWFVFGSRNRPKIAAATENTVPKNTEIIEPIAKVSETPAPTPEAAVQPKLENVVAVAGGEIAIGGGDTKRPIERVIVKDFSIAETEVTNAQYAEFIKDSNHTAPLGWKASTFPKGTENFPVVNVSWRDAIDFCLWMSKKSGLSVRLPTEAEWEMAASGGGGKKYPWGDEWNKSAAISEETGGKVSAVKSFSLNRSPFGAYDMVGNVWEWTQTKVSKNEDVNDKRVKDALAAGQVLRVVKGSSADEKSADISVQARYEIPENAKDKLVGFRYIVEQKP